MKKTISIPLTLGLLLPLAIGISACSSTNPASVSAPETVQGVALLQVHPQTVADTFQATGTVQAAETAQLAPQMMGTITAVNVTEGSRVAAGQVLARISAAQPQAGLQQAEASLSAAKQGVAAAQSGQALAASTMQRYELLHQRKSVSAQEYDEVRQQLQAANARLDIAKANEAQAEAAVAQAATALSFTQIRAPFSGVVTKRLVDPGALASPGMPLFVLDSIGGYRLEVTVDESSLPILRTGEPVQVNIDAIGNRQLTGKIVQIYPAVDADSRSFTVKIELPKDASLRSGLFGRATFTRGQKTSIVIPQSAILHQGNLASVYVVGPDRIAQLRYITLGGTVGSDVEVLSGLSADETIVAAPNGRELGGKRVEVQG